MATHGGGVFILWLVIVVLRCFSRKKTLNFFLPFVGVATLFKKSNFVYNLFLKKTLIGGNALTNITTTPTKWPIIIFKIISYYQSC
jgi:hypothetical protein